MVNPLKTFASRLPSEWQLELKRWHFRRMIRRGHFTPDEPEVPMLASFISAGDWVIDVGANVGQFTRVMSDLVGPNGRVIAIEPISDTVSLLAANSLLAPNRNVTVFNCALSDSARIVGMNLPQFDSGLPNYYQARIGEHRGPSTYSALALKLDSFELPARVSFVKIDAEGHEASVLGGMTRLLSTDRPNLLIETDDRSIADFLARYGYTAREISGSPNVLFLNEAGPSRAL